MYEATVETGDCTVWEYRTRTFEGVEWVEPDVKTHAIPILHRHMNLFLLLREGLHNRQQRFILKDIQ